MCVYVCVCDGNGEICFLYLIKREEKSLLKDLQVHFKNVIFKTWESQQMGR